jgi:MFS family permease
MATVAQPTYAPPAVLSRRGIVAFGASIAFLSFVDRAAISQAAPAIARDLHLSPVQMGLVFSAFSLTYALGEIPSGWLCDRFGARSVLTRVVILWSVLTAVTGLAWSYGSLVVIRLLFGAGESGCFPGLARMFRTWLAPQERNSAEGIKAACARFGAAATPPVMAALFVCFSWRTVFALFGLFGVVWALAFHRWYRDRPAELRRVASHGSGDFWRKLIASRSVWALGLQWFCHYYGFYFYITWLPLYVYQARGLDIRRGALAAAAPLLAAGIGCLAAGWATTALTARLRSTARARKLLGYFAYGGAAALLALVNCTSSAALAMLAMSLSSFAAEFSSPISWTTAMDIGGERVGTVSGFMNMLGHLGGSVAPAVTGFLLAWTGSGWKIAFWTSALIYAAGAVCWAFIDPVTPLENARTFGH